MREIKFRCWDKINKKMIRVDRLTFWISNDLGLMYINGNAPERYVVMQFTGLLDKSGHEIYEGDIIRFYFSAIGDKPAQMNDEVIYKEGMFCIRNLEDRQFVCSLWKWALNSKVIGNIYENPELTGGIK